MEKTNNNGDNRGKVGPIISTLIIILVLIAAALYAFASRIGNQSLRPVSNNADDIKSLQQDLNSSTAGLEIR